MNYKFTMDSGFKMKIHIILLMTLVLSGCHTDHLFDDRSEAEQYFDSAVAKEESGDHKGALNEYNKGIESGLKNTFYYSLPLSNLYRGRASLKCHHLNDTQGALDDYSSSKKFLDEIVSKSRFQDGFLDERLAFYKSRGKCSEDVLKNGAGAKADYAQADLFEKRINEMRVADDKRKSEMAKKQAAADAEDAKSAAANNANNCIQNTGLFTKTNSCQRTVSGWMKTSGCQNRNAGQQERFTLSPGQSISAQMGCQIWIERVYFIN